MNKVRFIYGKHASAPGVVEVGTNLDFTIGDKVLLPVTIFGEQQRVAYEVVNRTVEITTDNKCVIIVGLR